MPQVKHKTVLEANFNVRVEPDSEISRGEKERLSKVRLVECHGHEQTVRPQDVRDAFHHSRYRSTGCFIRTGNNEDAIAHTDTSMTTHA